MKKFLSTIIILVFAISLTACGGKNTQIDIDALADDLIEKVSFADELTKVDQNTVEKIYNINYAVAQNVYISSGATAEEIAIFEFKNEEDADKALEAANQRIDEQMQSFKDYIPKEVKKLEDAIVKKHNKYLIICISDGTEAEDVIDEYVK